MPFNIYSCTIRKKNSVKILHFKLPNWSIHKLSNWLNCKNEVELSHPLKTTAVPKKHRNVLGARQLNFSTLKNWTKWIKKMYLGYRANTNSINAYWRFGFSMANMNSAYNRMPLDKRFQLLTKFCYCRRWIMIPAPILRHLNRPSRCFIFNE